MYEFFGGNYRWSYTTLLAFAAGGQLGDIGLILPKLQWHAGDDAVWYEQWSWLGGVLETRATGCASPRAASDFYYLASLYHTMGEHFVPPADPQRLESYRHVLQCFAKACERAPFPIERVAVPYDGTTLPAYFMSAGPEPNPAVIFVCGLDTTKELWFLRAREQFTNRGISCLFIDTPGIGEALRLQKLYTRPDYERPVGAAVDYLSKRSDVDPGRIGLIGSSLGGYYASRERWLLNHGCAPRSPGARSTTIIESGCGGCRRAVRWLRRRSNCAS